MHIILWLSYALPIYLLSLFLLGNSRKNGRLKLQSWPNVRMALLECYCMSDRQSKMRKSTMIVLRLVPYLIVTSRATLPFRMKDIPKNLIKGIIIGLRKY